MDQHAIWSERYRVVGNDFLFGVAPNRHGRAQTGGMTMDDMERIDPLSDEELEELDRFLTSDAVGEEPMDLAMLDGFLTAQAVGPKPLPPSRWLPVVWGGDAVWESRRQAERIMSLVFRHANDILLYLREEPEDFRPLLYERDVDGVKVAVMDEWCAGFVEGIVLDEEHWRPMLESGEGERLLFPILLYGSEEGLERLRNDPTLEDRYEEFAASLGERVVSIMKWWLPVRKANSTTRRAEAKVGRNDPCPCGSGKKFKKCCG